MSIQGNVNQIISLSALLATQSPGVKAAGEKRAALRSNKNALKTINKRFELGKQNQLKTYQEGKPIEEAGTIGPVAQEKADLLREKYKLDPTMENWEAYKAAAIEAGDIATAEKNLSARRAEGEAFLEDFEQQLGQVPVEDRMSMIVDNVQSTETKSVEHMGQIDDPNTYRPLPAYVAHENAAKALEDAQTSRRLGRISSDWRPYM